MKGRSTLHGSHRAAATGLGFICLLTVDTVTATLPDSPYPASVCLYLVFLRAEEGTGCTLTRDSQPSLVAHSLP